MAPTRIEIGGIETLKDGEMKEVPFPEADSTSKILLSRVAGKYYATSNKCTHYGAPLIKGVLTGSGRVVCPWHGACFDVCTGDIEDAPGLNALQSFKVDVDLKSIFVTADPSTVASSRTPAPSSTLAPASSKGVVIVGGGAGAAHAVEGLREAGYAGSIKVLSAEAYLPVDRTKLSKALITDPAKIALRDLAFYEKLGVDFQLSTEVKSIDFEKDTVLLANGQKEEYDQLIVATGATATRIPVDGHKLDNIFVLRSVDDAAAIDAALGKDAEVKKNVVVVGSSFIGMEGALACSKRAHVSIVGMEDAPFERILGPVIGNGIRKYHEAQGTKFYLPAALSHFKPSTSSPSAVSAVVLKDGTEIPADLVILGVGVKPATAVLKSSGLDLEKDGSVLVDGQLRIKAVSKGNVFAVGDIATYPDSVTGDSVRVEHWNVASNHARAVAKTIAGAPDAAFDKVPIFWSAQGQQLRYAGSSKAKDWEDVFIQGEPDALKFVAYYTKGDEIVAAASMQSDPIVARVSELFALKKMLTASEVRAGKSPLDVSLV